MNITMDTPIEELLELWAKYSKEFIKKGERTDEERENIEKVSKILEKKGISSLHIGLIGEDSFTIGYLHKGSRMEKKIAIK